MSPFAPPFEQTPEIRAAYNVGCLFDIISGKYSLGKHGEALLSGGMTPVTAFIGENNTYKSTTADYFLYSAYAKFAHVPNVYGMKYDTELNVDQPRQKQLASGVEGLEGENNPFEKRCWNLTDKSIYTGNKWFEVIKKYADDKEKAASKLMLDTPFYDSTGEVIRIITPTFAGVDSFTEFDTDDVIDMRDDNELGESGNNMAFARQGLAKTHMVAQLPRIVVKGGIPMVMTAHLGDIILDQGGGRTPPAKKAQYLPGGKVIKGVTAKFNFLTHQQWYCKSATVLRDDDTKAPEYPNGSDDNVKGDTDLNEITVTLLRNKYGPSGMMMQVIVSQELGVLPTLSEFHYIKSNKRFGIEGGGQFYTLDLLPEVKISRATVRPKINELPKLRRAINITSESLQMIQLWSAFRHMRCSMKDLYADLKAIGYDWDYILEHTRGYWMVDNDSDIHEKKFLSTLDLWRMRVGLYVPYWWPQDKPLDLSKCKRLEGEELTSTLLDLKKIDPLHKLRGTSFPAIKTIY